MPNTQYLRSVTRISINKVNTRYCSISYKIIDGEPLNYNVYKLSSWGYTSSEMAVFCNIEHIKIKYDNFREYSKSISENERKTCGDLENTNKYTCENNGLIKSWYFYKHPEKYILYNDRENWVKYWII